MAINIGIFDAKTRLSEVIERVMKGEEFVITKHDKPVARIIPESAQRKESLIDAYEKFKNEREKFILNPPGLTKLDPKTLAREGLK